MADSGTVARELPVSRKEQAQWMLHRLAAGRGICNLGFVLRVGKPLRWWPCQEALNELARRHVALRSVIRAVGPELRKHVLATADIVVALDTHAGSDDELPEQIRRLAAEPFDLQRGPLIRGHLITLPGGSALCVVLHHIAADATTLSLLRREFVALYDAFADDREPPPAPAEAAMPMVGATDPAAVDRTAVPYWVRHLDGIDPGSLAIPGARPVPTRPTFAGDRLNRPLSDETAAAVKRLRDRTSTTDNIVLLAAYYLMLAAHGAGPDLVVGVLAQGRGEAQAGTVGFLANTLPLRVMVDFTTDFATLATTTRDVFLNGLAHGSASFESVQHELDTRSVDWRVPLFRHAFNFHPLDGGETTIAGVRGRVSEAYNGLSRLDLEFRVWSSPEALTLTATFSTEVHDRADIARMLDRYERLLIALDAQYDQPVGEIDAMTVADRTLIGLTNATHRAWEPGTVIDLVAGHAQCTPDAPAVGDWSYQRLMRAAGGVRHRLGQSGVSQGDVVALYADRGPWLAAAVLGVWACGAAYLPLDPAHPDRRIADQLNDAGVRVLLADQPVAAECSDGRVVVPLDNPADALTVANEPWAQGELAYICYTSGSTGRPKGVEVTHASLSNLVRSFAEILDARPEDRMLWLTTFSFDISALELLLPLTVGASVVVATADEQREPARLARFLKTERVTLAQATPTTWRQLVPELDGALRGCRVLCGGEPITAALAELLLADGCRLFNAYGPTETTIWSTVAELRSPLPERMTIGRPIANTVVHVLDPGGRVVPPGMPGELCIGGSGLALGYRGDPERTADRFRENSRTGRHYRTGDRVRQLADGQLEFLGRIDRQMKVRGHRVEPGEVETTIEHHPEIRAAAVFAQPDPAGHLGLIAAVQRADGGMTDDGLAERLRAHCAARLPAATVPSRFVVVARFPVTGNDKIDYAGLVRVCAGRSADRAPRLPADPALRLLVETWRAVLGDDRLSAESNFFLSGGHSLSAVELAGRLSAATGRQIGFDLVFEAPTPALLAARLESAGESRGHA